MRVPYGYENTTGQIKVNPAQANVVRIIYDLYLQGRSLGGIADELRSKCICSPNGNQTWVRAAIDKILVNSRYAPAIVTPERYWAAQIERERRTNIGDDGRKTARYNSQNVLSGLLVCDDCGSNYRRITRVSGEVVWRCADKVEEGKRSDCGNKNTITDTEIKQLVCEVLSLDKFDDQTVKEEIEQIRISNHRIVIYKKVLVPLKNHVIIQKNSF